MIVVTTSSTPHRPEAGTQRKLMYLDTPTHGDSEGGRVCTIGIRPNGMSSQGFNLDACRTMRITVVGRRQTPTPDSIQPVAHVSRSSETLELFLRCVEISHWKLAEVNALGSSPHCLPDVRTRPVALWYACECHWGRPPRLGPATALCLPMLPRPSRFSRGASGHSNDLWVHDATPSRRVLIRRAADEYHWMRWRHGGRVGHHPATVPRRQEPQRHAESNHDAYQHRDQNNKCIHRHLVWVGCNTTTLIV